MADTLAHPTQKNVDLLRKAVELAAKEATEAQAILHKAKEEKIAIHRIPKRKAGGGKEAKSKAYKNYMQARDYAKKKALFFEKANADLESALLQATATNGDESDGGDIVLNMLWQPSSDTSCNADNQKDLGEEAAINEKGVKPRADSDRVASELFLSAMCRKDPDPSRHLDETPPSQTLSEGGPSSDEPLGGSDKQEKDSRKAAVNVERQVLQTQGYHATPESSLPELIPRDPNQTAPEVVSMGFPKPLIEEASKVLEAEQSREESLHSRSEAVPEKRSGEEKLNGPTKKRRVGVTTTRESRSTTSKKKPELEDIGSARQMDPPSDTDEENEAERLMEAKKFKHLSLNEEEKRMYRFMKQDDKESYATKGRIAIEQYLHANKQIDRGIRRMARLDPAFLPEAATTSQDLALHFLTSNEGNVMCGYHAFKNKASYIRDGWGKPSMKVRGVPGKRKVATSEQKVKHDPKGLANCGCRIQDVLLEFALSKLVSISGLVDGERRSEMMSFADYMEPRARSFTFQAIRLMVPDLSLDDFYTHREAIDHGVKTAKKRVHYWVKTLNDRFRATATPEEFTEEYEIKVVTRAREPELSEAV